MPLDKTRYSTVALCPQCEWRAVHHDRLAAVELAIEHARRAHGAVDPGLRQSRDRMRARRARANRG